MKQALIALRVDPAEKARIAEAARAAGTTVSEFMLQATRAQLERGKNTRGAARKAHRGPCPTFFRALCATAQEGGGGIGYDAAGYELMRHLSDQQPSELDDAQWRERVRTLEQLLARRSRDSDAKVIEWFETNLPLCVALVPTRRRARFLEGARSFLEENGEIEV